MDATMIIHKKTLEKLRILINEETEYRSGPKLVDFFNDLGFNDTYSQGFPSRWYYTDQKLSKINGTPELDKCIKKLFDPRNFIGRFSDLDAFIKDFNQYLQFDSWKVVRNGPNVSIQKQNKLDIDQSEKTITDEKDFLAKEFDEIPIEKIGLEESIISILTLRLEEIKNCLNSNSPLSVVLLAGSSLEGILLGIALNHPRQFNQSKCSPKYTDGTVKRFHEWTLSNFIDVAHDLGFLREDVKEYSHSLRDFRNYIHPYQQYSSKFNPDKHTAKISWQVLQAAIYQISENVF